MLIIINFKSQSQKLPLQADLQPLLVVSSCFATFGPKGELPLLLRQFCLLLRIDFRPYGIVSVNAGNYRKLTNEDNWGRFD